MRKAISQREARALRKRVAELERERDEQRNRWANFFPGGTHIGTLLAQRDWLRGRIEGARMLGHAVVVTAPNNDGNLEFYALPLGSKT